MLGSAGRYRTVVGRQPSPRRTRRPRTMNNGDQKDSAAVRGYAVGCYQGYVVVYDPAMFFILGVVDLLT